MAHSVDESGGGTADLSEAIGEVLTMPIPSSGVDVIVVFTTEGIIHYMDAEVQLFHIFGLEYAGFKLDNYTGV